MAFGVLFVCTGNLCRSPMAERLFAAGLGGAAGFEVTSAGTWGIAGAPMEPFAADAVHELGGDPDGFLGARDLTVTTVETAELILTASREHRAAVVTLSPRAAGRTFTIREFARLVAAVDPATLLAGPPAVRAQSLVRAAAARRGLVPPVAPADDDIPDPYRGPASVFRDCATLIQDGLAGPLSVIVASTERTGAGS
ncbi:MAG TPA: hypothetical protein VNG13_16110 [Mycobacteriales bacterium]|nr:hypothetical protein [Mycobacteriales bacterium]